MLNAENSIQRCLESIFLQDFKDYEVIIQDGGSNDSSIEIVLNLLRDNKTNVHINSESDCGVYDAMNKGVKVSKGTYLFFIGADDTLANPNVLNKVNKELQYHQPDILYGQVRYKDSDIIYGSKTSLDNLLFNANIPHQAVFYHQSLFQRLGPFNLRYKVWADWEFNIRCFRIPNLNAHYIDQVISIFDNVSGLSSKELDPLFMKESPIFIPIPLQHEIIKLKQCQAYRWGSKLVALKNSLLGRK